MTAMLLWALLSLTLLKVLWASVEDMLWTQAQVQFLPPHFTYWRKMLMRSPLVTVPDGPHFAGCPEPSDNLPGMAFSITDTHGHLDMPSQLWGLSQNFPPGYRIHTSQSL